MSWVVHSLSYKNTLSKGIRPFSRVGTVFTGASPIACKRLSPCQTLIPLRTRIVLLLCDRDLELVRGVGPVRRMSSHLDGEVTQRGIVRSRGSLLIRSHVGCTPRE